MLNPGTTRGPASSLDDLRYSRQLLASIDGRGLDQAKISAGRVALIGAGTLGSNYAEGAAATGVGSIDIFDFDTVGPETRGRSIAFVPDDDGRPKAVALADRVRQLNPDVEARGIVANALLLGGATWEAYDVLVLATDNVLTRLNLSSLALQLPRGPQAVLEAGLAGFDWSVQVMGPGTHCYRCSFLDSAAVNVSRSCNGVALDVGGAVLPTTLPAAFSAVGIMIQETLLALSGSAPVFLGREVRASMTTAELSVLRINPRPSCKDHIKWREEDVFRLPFEPTHSVGQIREHCARELRLPVRDLTLAAPHRLLKTVTCFACGATVDARGYVDGYVASVCRECGEVVGSVNTCRCGAPAPPPPLRPFQRLKCPACGQLDPNGFDIEASTILQDDDVTVERSGIPAGEVLGIYAGDIKAHLILEGGSWTEHSWG
ncbi:MAG: hypothetical protein A2148_08600 [Chloroflexi bacterium RBG_16_68_14]|nr:MAG: hypothetical protein A2148_08600 [Chloroflexi bacterium RBG_16_68_14]